MKKKAYLTPNEVATLFMVSPITVRQWAQRGMIKAVNTAGGHRRFTWAEIHKFAQERNIEIEGLGGDDGRRLLIVDDDPMVSGYLFELFVEDEAIDRVDVAIDGFDAGAKVESFKPTVIILDLMMPGLDGFEVCRRLRANPATRDVRIVAVTGYYSDGNVQKIVEAGADACLPKPIDVKQLRQALGLDEVVASNG